MATIGELNDEQLLGYFNAVRGWAQRGGKALRTATRTENILRDALTPQEYDIASGKLRAHLKGEVGPMPTPDDFVG